MMSELIYITRSKLASSCPRVKTLLASGGELLFKRAVWGSWRKPYSAAISAVPSSSPSSRISQGAGPSSFE